MPPAQLLARLAPPLFVVIWATGFIVARVVAPHAEPLTFLLVRYLLAALVLSLIVTAASLPWPRTWRDSRRRPQARALLLRLSPRGAVRYRIVGGPGVTASWPAPCCTASISAASSGP